jgi:hypothetical protein
MTPFHFLLSYEAEDLVRTHCKNERAHLCISILSSQLVPKVAFRG